MVGGPFKDFYAKRMEAEDFLAELVFKDLGTGGGETLDILKLEAALPGERDYCIGHGMKFPLKDPGDVGTRILINTERWQTAEAILELKDALHAWSPSAAKKFEARILKDFK